MRQRLSECLFERRNNSVVLCGTLDHEAPKCIRHHTEHQSEGELCRVCLEADQAHEKGNFHFQFFLWAGSMYLSIRTVQNTLSAFLCTLIERFSPGHWTYCFSGPAFCTAFSPRMILFCMCFTDPCVDLHCFLVYGSIVPKESCAGR